MLVVVRFLPFSHPSVNLVDLSNHQSNMPPAPGANLLAQIMPAFKAEGYMLL